MKEGFVDAVFTGDPLPIPDGPGGTPNLHELLLRGGYPEVLSRSSESRRRAWFGSYVTTILQRDGRDLSNIEGLTELPRLLSLLAARSASLVNFAELSRSASMPQSTLKRYVSLLEATFLVETLPAWSSNLGKRLVRSPKLLLCDTGLISGMQGLSAGRLASDPVLVGPLLENVVAMEIQKQSAWSDTQPRLFQFRTQTGQEVDVVMENAAGRVGSVEVKASATVGARDFRGLRALAEASGDRFRRGVILYTGRTAVPFGENLHALPVSSLWSMTA